MQCKILRGFGNKYNGFFFSFLIIAIMQMIEIIRMLQAITLRNRRLWKNAGNIESNINIKLIMTPIGNDIKKRFLCKTVV